MSTTDLESSIKENEESLKEIRELLLLSPEESELKNLATELENLIKIQQEQILQTKKKELLARFGLTEEKNDENGKTNFKMEGVDMLAQNNFFTNNEEMEILQPGNKCCIPWTHPDYEKVYFLPGLIHSINTEKRTCDVLILTPITQSTRLCEKYISSQCNTTSCPHNCSHGEEISFELVAPYELLNIGNMDAYQVGRYFWAKYKDDEVWYMAKLISIETGGQGFRIIYKGYEDEHPNGFVVSHDEIIPVVGLDNEHDESDEESSYSEYSDECGSLSESDSSSLRIGLDTINIDDISSNNQNDTQIHFAEWEKHTRGVASRMMAKMGYKMGEGLGKNSEGITNPIEVKLFSKGVSLDFIDKKGTADQTGPHRRRRHRHKSEGSKIANSGTNISHGRIKEHTTFSSTENNNSDPQQTVFDFLNVSLNKGKHRDNNNLTGVSNISTSSLQSNTSAGSSSNNNSSTDRSHKYSSEASQLQLYHIQNQLNQKSQELQKAKESFKRNEKKDPTMANHFREKINEIETTYQVLKRKEQEIQRGLDRAKGRKKMTIF